MLRIFSFHFGLRAEMCELETVRAAREAADELLEVLRLPVAKGLDLMTATGFERAVAALAARLSKEVNGSEREAVQAAVDALDVDWSSTTASRRRELVRAARTKAASALQAAPRRLRTLFRGQAEEVVGATRKGLRASGLPISAEFNAVDRRVVDYLVSANALFVTDAYGQRLDDFTEDALHLVAEGLEAGLPRSEIVAALSVAAESLSLARTGFYWEVLASAFVATGRTFSQVSGYAEAGISHYLVEAVLDEQTTEVCRFLHGKRFAVSDALDRFDHLSTLKDPAEIKAAHPWLRKPEEAEGLAVGLPPFHGMCRTLVVPDV